MKTVGLHKRLRIPGIVGMLMLLAAAFHHGAPTASGQPDGSFSQTVKRPVTVRQRSFRLQVSVRSRMTVISLKASRTALAEITSELQFQLRVPVILSGSLLTQRASLRFTRLPLEAALRRLAPLVFIDYEISGNVASPPRPLGIYLYTLNEAPPTLDAVVKNTSEAFLIEGDTDEVIPSPAVNTNAQTLRVSYENNLLSVRARRQPLSIVLYNIARALGIPFVMRFDSRELIDADFVALPIEKAIQRLSPQAQFDVRYCLQNSSQLPLRLVLTKRT